MPNEIVAESRGVRLVITMRRPSLAHRIRVAVTCALIQAEWPVERARLEAAGVIATARYLALRLRRLASRLEVNRAR